MPTACLAGLVAAVAIAAAGRAAADPADAFCPPAGLVTVAEDGQGKRSRTVWQGADPDDPQVCLADTPAGRRAGTPERKLFGRWKQSELVLAAGEEAAFRRSVASILSGASESAQFILRQRNEQVVQHWRVTGREDLRIGGRSVPALAIRVNYTYSGTTAQWFSELWFVPSLKLFARSRPSVDYLLFGPENMNRYTWSVVSIAERGAGE